jgi:hypothetical protein
MDRARELLARLEENADMSECDAARRAYLEDWEDLQPTYAPVLIAGPSQIEESAENLRFCLGDPADECDGWYTARKTVVNFVTRKKSLAYSWQPEAPGLNLPQPPGITYTVELTVVSLVTSAHRHECAD